ncbi:MAG: DNA-3-methyladenine glycosylase, partial [Candidatus Bathyarchaeota archaeon]
PGKTFIYNVHQYWMFNIVAHKPNEIGGVLIRAIEPTKGIEVMRRNRPVSNITKLTSGPGKLTISLAIDKSLNGIEVSSSDSDIFVCDDKMKYDVARSHRIGVKRDLERKLRFYIKENKFVSR